MTAPLTAPLSNYFGNLVLSTLITGKTFYLALHHADPTVLGDPASEVIGKGYIRQAITFGQPSGKAVVNTAAFAFGSLPIDIVTYFAIWDSISGGHMLWPIALGEQIDLATLDGVLRGEPGDLALAL